MSITRPKIKDVLVEQAEFKINSIQLQADLDTWIKYYNEERTHSGKYCFGKTPMQTFLDSMPLVREKILNNTLQTEGACLSD